MKQLRHDGSNEATDQLYALALGPDFRARSYSACIVNGVRFHTRDRDSRRKSQNSGVVVEGEHDDKLINFYGVLKEVLVLDYPVDNKVVLFRCDWFDIDDKKKGIQKDDYFTSLNVSRRWYENDPFVLAIQAKQVFYINDPKLGTNWQIVQEIHHGHVYDVPEVVTAEMDDGDVNMVTEEVYQENEPSNFVHVHENEVGALNREDILPEMVDASIVQTSKRGRQTDDFISYDDEEVEEENEVDEGDEEDETLIEYMDESDDHVCVDDDDDSDINM